MFKKTFPYGKVAFSFVLGAIAGAAAAALLTPLTGKKMRRELADVVEEQVDNVEKMVKKVVNA